MKNINPKAIEEGMEIQRKNSGNQTVIIQQVRQKSNGLGVAGFVLSLVGLLLVWVPILDVILLLLGFIFSFCGMFKSPRGLAIAGFCVSLVGLVIIMAIAGLIGVAYVESQGYR